MPSTARWARTSTCATRCSPSGSTRWTASFQDERGYSILELILDDSVDYTEGDLPVPIEVVQLVIFAIQIALGELLRHHGAKPAAVIGQSLGEAAAAYFAGGLSLVDATAPSARVRT